MTNGEVAGQVYAKSGYISGTITLSGYLVTAERTAAFSMLLNNFALGGRDAQQMMEKIIAIVDRHYASTAPEAVARPQPAEPAIGG
jgi:D-alanyl-D-alanine carboxypeptidase